MPLFEFECKNCSVGIFEKLVDADKKETDCPNCGKLCLRVISSFSVGIKSQYQNIDRIIGADAERKWEIIHKRQETKEKLIKEGKLKRPEKVLVSKQPDSSFNKGG